MRRGAEPGSDIVGVSWGSARFNAYRIRPDGSLLDAFETSAGVLGLDRAGMAAAMTELSARWPGHGPVVASGMIGSALGWVEAAYVDAPAGAREIAGAAVAATIGATPVMILPGVACRRASDGAPDVLRGEEVELVGVLAGEPGLDGIVALAGAHGRWVRVQGGRIVEFVTSVSGEIYDRLTGAGLLASVVEGEAREGAAFLDGVVLGSARRLGLGALLFGARARVVRGDLARRDAASVVRGLLIGADVADLRACYAERIGEEVVLVGDATNAPLHAAALSACGVRSRRVDPLQVRLRGFRALMNVRHGCPEVGTA